MDTDVIMCWLLADVDWPFAIFSKGNEAFVAENYSSAIDLYTAALGIDPLFADCLVARAHAYIKSDKFEQAKEWMNDKNQAKWGKRPACFLGSKVAKELLNFTNSGS